MARFVKQTQLVRSSRPDLGQHGRIERRAVGDDLVGLNADVTQLLEKAFAARSVYIALNQLVADEPITIGRRRVNRKQEGELPLIDFINTQNTREFLHDPGLVISREVKAPSIGAAPLANAGLTGLYPEIAGEAFGHAAHGHPILVDGGDGGRDDPIGVASIGTEEGRLDAEVMLAGGAEMHADGDEQQGRAIEIEVNGDALGGRKARGGLLAAVTRYGWQQVRDLTHLTKRMIDGQCGETVSFLVGVVQIVYHAGTASASQQTSITQSPLHWYMLASRDVTLISRRTQRRHVR